MNMRLNNSAAYASGTSRDAVLTVWGLRPHINFCFHYFSFRASAWARSTLYMTNLVIRCNLHLPEYLWRHLPYTIDMQFRIGIGNRLFPTELAEPRHEWLA